MSRYDNSWYRPGRGALVRLAWYFVNALLIQSPLNPFSRVRVSLLRLFGAQIGQGVRIKPGVNVKYPWNVSIGDHTWIGEGVWLDSLAPIEIGAHVCLSQDAYLCTGNHNWSDPHFGLIVKPIRIEDGAWVGARAVMLPGSTLASHAVVCAGSTFSGSAQPSTIYAGVPAQPVKTRVLSPDLSQT